MQARARDRSKLKTQSFQGLRPWTPTGALPLDLTWALKRVLDPTPITIWPPTLKTFRRRWLKRPFCMQIFQGTPDGREVTPSVSLLKAAYGRQSEVDHGRTRCRGCEVLNLAPAPSPQWQIKRPRISVTSFVLEKQKTRKNFKE